MASAFTLALALLGEQCSARDTGWGLCRLYHRKCRVKPVREADVGGGRGPFWVGGQLFCLAGLNLAGAILVYLTIDRAPPMEAVDVQKRSASHVLAMHLGNSRLRAAFAIGFCILFAFIGTFTYVNFVLARPPFAIGMMSVGFVYFVFAPSFFTTPLAGKAVARWGTRCTMCSALGLAGFGLTLMLAPRLSFVIAGMVLVGTGTFFVRAVATGFAGRAATTDRGAASGLYLACYYCGGLAGTAVLGWIFDSFGWAACVSGVGLTLPATALLTSHLVIAPDAAR